MFADHAGAILLGHKSAPTLPQTFCFQSLAILPVVTWPHLCYHRHFSYAFFFPPRTSQPEWFHSFQEQVWGSVLTILKFHRSFSIWKLLQPKDLKQPFLELTLCNRAVSFTLANDLQDSNNA